MVHGRVDLLQRGHWLKLGLLDQALFLILISHASHQHAVLLIKLHGHAEHFLLLSKLWFGVEVTHHGWVGLVDKLQTILIKSQLL